MKICDKNLLCYIQQSGNSTKSTTGRPEIDRPKLRELLYNSLAGGTVKWNHKLLHVDSNLSLHFTNSDSISQSFDLIVGGDGAWSKVRPLLSSSSQPFFSGIAGHSFTIPSAETNTPDLYNLVNRGSLFAFSDAKSITA